MTRRARTGQGDHMDREVEVSSVEELIELIDTLPEESVLEIDLSGDGDDDG